MVAARYPVARAGWGYAFREISRRHGDFAIVALAAAVGDGKIRLGVGGVADKPAVREWDELDDDGSPMRSTILPGISAAATTSMRPRATGARWFGGSERR